jgi:hypothetical protein
MFFTVLIVLQCISLAQVHAAFCLFTQTPEQLRVALRGPNGVTVSWRTPGFFGSNDTPKPQLVYSTDSNLLNGVQSPIGTTSNYNTESFFHNVPLLNLAASTTYYYQILATTQCVTKSGINSFTTAPAAGNANPVNITFVADLGNDNLINGGGASRTIKALGQVASSTNVFVHNGDISYADDYGVLLPPETYEGAWNKFQNNVQSITSQKFYMTGPGNHEVTCFQLGDAFCGLSSARNFSAYLNRFRMPGDESGGYKNLWYSFNYGLVHVVVINTETDFPNAPSGPGTTLNGGNFQGTTGQLSWLQTDLQNAVANRARVPWIVVTGHRPFFGSTPAFPAIPGNCAACATAFYQVLVDNKVDLYISAHVHWYERLYPVDATGSPVASDYINSPGLIHITNGAGGAAEGAAQIQSTIPASAKIVTGYGYSQLQIKDASNAVLTFFSSDSNQVADTVNIVRNH